ncbi:uncharacterized protein LOC144388991 [Gasterosteus aculeatus]
MMTTELFIVSLVVLLLAVMVLLLLCWVLRNSRNSDVTEMQISAGEPARVLTIRTKSQFANQLLDIVLDRVILQVESEPQTGEEPQVESEMDPGEHLRGERGSGPMKAVNNLASKLQKWMTAGDKNTARTDAPEHAALPSDGASCSASREEEKQQESQL